MRKYETIINKIEEHRAAMKLVREKERELNDLWTNGYNRGILDGLEAAINIIKQIEAEQYRKITDAYVKKAKAAQYA